MKRIAIFKVGRHTAMSGYEADYDAAALEASARAYDPAKFEAPVVIGHPEHNAPAWGWVKKLEFADDTLWADLDELDPQFLEMVEAGRFKKISASFYLPSSTSNPAPGVLYLRHVGFLGAAPPAVKGLPLPDLSHAEGVEEFVEERAIPQSNAQKTPAKAAFTEGEPRMSDELKARLDALEAENARLKAEAEAARERLAAKEREARHAQHLAFCEDLVKAGRLPPGASPVIAAVLDHLAEAPAEFGEGSDKKPLPEAFKTALSGLPQTLVFGEIASARGETPERADFAAPAGYDVDPRSAEIHARALAYRRAHPQVDYVAAVKAVIRQ
ncbi:MAG TPA: hypothetical protein VNL74_03995 [Methylococcus sp.]|nr:hypothetical protein [Methylococcus sp.]